ncbi:MAG: glycine cleavage system protein GcvH [Actinomycetia bacterium]|nr:glycine cleavage system protein GcvH [Actinomycetes bacterium]
MKIGEYDFPEDLFYEKNHFWAKDDGSGNIVIGATDFFQQLAGEIVFIELPMTGTKIEQNKTFSSLESGKWVGKVFAPFSGEVIETNEELEDSPELINESPYDEGWIAKIKPSDFDGEAGNLMKTGPDFEKFINDESKKYAKEN